MADNINKKIGARRLSEAEIKMILPTYDKLIEQIEMVRNDKWDLGENTNVQNQKTNNIGILGARGTGKTSIIKTLMNDLEEDNILFRADNNYNKNIILPMIVPEVMSENVNIMAVILGLFKPIIDKLREQRNNENKKCWEIDKSEIEEKYDELVKKYCFIQQEYKQVAINEYTSENDYVRKSVAMYKADIEFLPCFNEFIKLLLKEDKVSKNAEKINFNERLIFIFIDDIDLTTLRCVDVVKTLLAYISHPRIVTILSGDLETFEEALTLDFVRKESGLRGDILEKEFVNANRYSVFLDRKKILSYEYLKKVLPPQYRHSVKHWSIFNRGEYAVEIEENKNGEKLVELLQECFGSLECPPIFQYKDFSKNKFKNLPQSFHIFDDTARGLNSIYNILIDIKASKHKDGQVDFQQIKMLLENIIATNKILSSHRSVLFEDVIQFATNSKDTEIYLDNFEIILENIADNGKDTDRNRLDKFRLFSFLDLAIRLLGKNDLLKNDIYLDMKDKSLIDLLTVPLISGALQSRDDILRDNLKIYSEKIFKEFSNIIYRNNREIIFEFLFRLDWQETVVLYNYLMLGYVDLKNDELDDEKLLNIYWTMLSVIEFDINNFKGSDDIGVLKSKYIASKENLFAAYKIILEVYNSEEISSIISKFIKNNILPSPDIKSEVSIGNIIYLVNKEDTKYTNSFVDIDKAAIFEIEYNKLFINFLSYEMKNRIFKNNMIISLAEKENEYIKIAGSKYKKHLNIIFVVDKNNLWSDPNSKNIKTYVYNRIQKLLNKIKINENTKINIQELKNSYDAFRKIYKGRDTIASRLWSFLCKLSIEVTINTFAYITLKKYIILKSRIRRLAYSRAWYGIGNAYSMLRDLEKANLIIDDTAGVEQSDLEELYMWFHIYSSFKSLEFGDIYLEASEISKFVTDIYNGLKRGSENNINNYKEKLEEYLDKDIVAEFEDLFNPKE